MDGDGRKNELNVWERSQKFHAAACLDGMYGPPFTRRHGKIDPTFSQASLFEEVSIQGSSSWIGVGFREQIWRFAYAALAFAGQDLCLACLTFSLL